MKKKKLLFICPNLKGGGVERMLINLLVHLNPQQFTIFLVLFEDEGIYREDVPGFVKKICLYKKNKFSQFRILLLLAFRLFPRVKPDKVISFMLVPNILSLLASLLSPYKTHTIISIRNNPEMDIKTQRLWQIKKFLMKILYPQTAKMIVISEGIKKTLIKKYGFKENKIKVVYNGINIQNVKTQAHVSMETDLFQQKKFYYVTACGRLTFQKGFSDLIKAFSQVVSQVNAGLYIFGEGEERQSLTDLINALGMTHNIFLPGYKSNPFPYIAQSDLFVLSSLYEGFGNVIVEAMACGTPIIAVNCDFGPGEIINHGMNGILIPPNDVLSMSSSIMTLLKNEPLRKRLALAAKDQVKNFDVSRMVSGYKSVFHE